MSGPLGELLGSIPLLWRRDQTWRISAGTLAVVDGVSFSVSISLVSRRFVVVAVPGSNGNKSSWETIERYHGFLVCW